LRIITNFISKEEEELLLKEIGNVNIKEWRRNTWNGRRESIYWGAKLNILKREVLPGPPLPLWCEFLIERMRTIDDLSSFVPNHLHINHYIKDKYHSIKPHVDDRMLGGERFVIISLVGDCTMTMIKEDKPDYTMRVLLPRFSLEIMQKTSRYAWKHAIFNKDFHHNERISIIFRQVER